MKLAIAAAMLLLPAAAARAERLQVFSLRGLDGGDAGDRIAAQGRRHDGVNQAGFDLYACEWTVRLAGDISNPQVIEWVQKAGDGYRALVGPGQGRYLPPLEYPAGADVAVLTRDGSAVGPLEKLRAPNRTTVFDFYADWCVACRGLDLRLRDFALRHPGVTIRKLDVRRWDSPLAREIGPRLTALPYLVVFTPEGKRQDFVGAEWNAVAKRMRWR